MKKIVSIFTILAIMLVSFNTDIKYEIKAKDSQIEQSYIVKTNNVKLIDKIKNQYEESNTTSDYADEADVVKERFEVAKDVAVNALSHFKNNTVGTANDFCKSANYNKNIFKLFNFKEYLNGVGAKDLAEKMENYSLTYK